MSVTMSVLRNQSQGAARAIRTSCRSGRARAACRRRRATRCSRSVVGSGIGSGQRQSYGLFGRQCGHGCTYSVLRFMSGGGDTSRGGGIFHEPTQRTEAHQISAACTWHKDSRGSSGLCTLRPPARARAAREPAAVPDARAHR